MFFLQSWRFEVYQLTKTANCHIDLSYKIIETDLKNNSSLSFPTTRMLASILHEFCRNLNWLRNLSWLRNRVQSQQQKNKVKFDSSLRGGVGGGRVPLLQVVLGGFWVVMDWFCWLRVTSDGFRWFADLVVTSISQHTEHLTLYRTDGRTWLTKVIRFLNSK